MFLSIVKKQTDAEGKNCTRSLEGPCIEKLPAMRMVTMRRRVRVVSIGSIPWRKAKAVAARCGCSAQGAAAGAVRNYQTESVVGSRWPHGPKRRPWLPNSAYSETEWTNYRTCPLANRRESWPPGGVSRTGFSRLWHAPRKTHTGDADHRRTKKLRAVQLHPGHTRSESTVSYLRIAVNDAVERAGQTEVNRLSGARA